LVSQVGIVASLLFRKKFEDQLDLMINIVRHSVLGAGENIQKRLPCLLPCVFVPCVQAKASATAEVVSKVIIT
jgi:hypothetical protein